MIKLLGGLPQSPVIALSGGVDSMVVADFISRSREIKCAFFHHNTDTSNKALEFVTNYCNAKNWSLRVGYLSCDKPSDQSKEEFWRNKRYEFLDSLKSPIITGHHLDDVIETYLWSTLHGTSKLIPYQRNNVIRPFLTTPKSEMFKWARSHDIPWIEDLTNTDPAYTRNYIRYEMMPRALHVNPGLHTTVAKKVKVAFNKDQLTVD